MSGPLLEFHINVAANVVGGFIFVALIYLIDRIRGRQTGWMHP